MQRSIEQRERAAKELHSRIHELEGTESNLNQSYSTLSLKVRKKFNFLTPFHAVCCFKSLTVQFRPSLYYFI